MPWRGAGLKKHNAGERDMPKAFSVKTLAERWDCSTRLIYQLIDDGELKAFPLGKRGLRICADEVNRCESLIAKSSNIEDSDSADEATPTLPTTAMKTAVADARN
jgi:excisionase family DNA binding protein